MFSSIFTLFKKSDGVEKGQRQLLKRVEELVAQAKTVEAIDLLIDAGVQDAPLLKNQWLTAVDAYEKGKMPFDVWMATNNRINFAILEMLRPKKAGSLPVREPEIEVKTTPPIEQAVPLLSVSREQVAGVRRLLEEKGLEEALNACAEWNTTYLILQKRFAELNRVWLMGLLNEEEWNLGNNQIKFALISLLDDQATEANS